MLNNLSIIKSHKVLTFLSMTILIPFKDILRIQRSPKLSFREKNKKVSIFGFLHWNPKHVLDFLWGNLAWFRTPLCWTESVILVSSVPSLASDTESRFNKHLMSD